jgi:hypothetical protein
MVRTGWKRMQTAGGYYERLYSSDIKDGEDRMKEDADSWRLL